MKYYFLSLFLLVSCLANGATSSSAPSMKIHIFQHLYAGDEHKTFDTDLPAYGVELISLTQNANFNYFSKGRLTSLSGEQEFLDGAAEVDSKFTYYQSSFEMGFTVSPLPRGKGMNLYVGASGVISYNYLSLQSNNLTTLKPTYQGISFGYTGVMGIEWFLFGSDYCMSLEFSQRFEKAKLAGQSQFQLDGFNISFGMAW